MLQNSTQLFVQCWKSFKHTFQSFHTGIGEAPSISFDFSSYNLGHSRRRIECHSHSHIFLSKQDHQWLKG